MPSPPLTDVEQILDLAQEALDRGDPAASLDLCGQVLSLLPDHPGALFLAAESYRDFRDLDSAEHYYRTVLRLTPDHSTTWSALATVLFDQLRFDEARTHALRAIRLDPGNAEAYYCRAMMRERRGDHHGAQRDYLRAQRIEPPSWPMPVHLDDATIEAVVTSALHHLHPSIRAYLAQVPILLEEVPQLEVLQSYDPPAPPGEILGFFTGIPLTERSMENPWSNLPSAIVLYRCNIERFAWDQDHLIEQLRITVFHEVGHFLGLSEEDLTDRGLD